MKREWMNTRQTRYSAYTSAYVLVVAAVLAGVNYLASQHTKSIDLTANKRYTLSDQTNKIVKNLKDEVKIYYFDDTKNFQPAKDLLDQYEALSGKLKVQYVDTVKNPRLLREFNVTVAPTTIIVHDKRQSEAHGVTEQELTSALIRVLKNGEKTACFLTGNGERDLEGNGGPDFAGVKDALKRNNFNTDAITLIAKPEIPATCSVVVAAGPKSDYQPAEVEALKSYVEKGGHALFLLDPPLDFGRSRIAPNEALVKVLRDWGVTLEKNLVLEVSGLSRLGPEWALGNHFGSHPIVRDMKGSAAAFPLTRSLDAKPGANTSAEAIVSTSKSSFATTQITGKGIAIDPSKGEKKSYDVAAAGSYRTGVAGKEGRFVVVGCSGFASNSALDIVGNRDLFLNIMDWLTNDEDLISIRPKDPEDRRIQLTQAQALLVPTVSLILIPLTVILAGVLVWLKRR